MEWREIIIDTKLYIVWTENCLFIVLTAHCLDMIYDVNNDNTVWHIFSLIDMANLDLLNRSTMYYAGFFFC